MRQSRYLIRRSLAGHHTFEVTGYRQRRTPQVVAERENRPMFNLSQRRAWPSRLLAFARVTEPRHVLSYRAVGLDALLACAAVIASLTIDERLPGGEAALAAQLITTAPLTLRRVYPVAVFWVVLLGIVAESQDANFISFGAIMLAAYSAVVHSRYRGAAVLSVLVAGVMVTAIFSDTTIPQPGRFTALFILVPAVLVGKIG